MHVRNRFCLVLLAALVPAVHGVSVGAACADGQVLLNEVLADPASDWDGDSSYSSRDDEFVEIVNAGTSAVTLDGWRIAGADTTWRYEFTGTLAPGEVRVVYGSQSYQWETDNGWPKYGLRLSNTGGEVTLWHLAGADTALVDSYTYQDFEAEDDRSSGRVPDGGPDWKLFDAMNPYDGADPPLGTGCAPSPGGPQSCSTPVERTTWGGVKVRYGG